MSSRARSTITHVPTTAITGAAIQAHSTRPIALNTSQLSGTSATKYTASEITTNDVSGTSTPAASTSASRATFAVALKSFHAPMPPTWSGGRSSRSGCIPEP